MRHPGLILPLFATVLAACGHVPARVVEPHPSIAISFDYSGAELMLDALRRDELTENSATALLQNRAIDAMIRKSMVWVPTVTREDFVPYLEGVRRGNAPESVFSLTEVAEQEDEVRALMRVLQTREAEMESRMVSRLTRFSPLLAPISIDVFFLVGGSSDGFVLDDDPRLALFVALDKASGDADGVEQNMTHELYHVMQKAAAQRTPQAAEYARTIETKSPLEQLLMTTLLEGTANFVADARETAGSGPYVSMWRGRYLRNMTPQRREENFRRFDRVLTGLHSGTLGWQEAYDLGFSGSDDSRFYFVGMEMARAIAARRGPGYFVDLFSRLPVQFFRDYLALPGVAGSATDLSAAARAVIGE